MIWKPALVVLVALVALMTPLPPEVPPWAQLARVGLATLVLLCTLGKLLYDTLFYDRWR